MKWYNFLLVAAATVAAVSLHATSVVPPEFSELVNESDYIVRTKVKAVSTELRANGDGNQPLIFTKVELEVEEVIVGTPPSPLVLTMLGGKSGDRELVVEGAPKFYVGNEDILFVKDNGKAIVPLFAIMHGQYPVLKDAKTGREYVTRSDLSPLASTAEVSQPFGEGANPSVLIEPVVIAKALSPTAFAAQIRVARAAGQVAQKNSEAK